MNHIYRLVWSAAQHAVVAVAETARSRGKGATSRSGRVRVLAGMVLLCAPAVALALPSGGHVVAGQATLHRDGSTLSVHQTTPKAILDWKSFGIGKRQTVTFHQPGRSSVVLNRVTSSGASAIYGHLNANGQVFLVNPNGVFFAKGAEVSVGGIVASTLGITNQDFLAGKYHFSGNSAAGVVNAGRITAAQGGYVAFIGRSVGNQGVIDTPSGTTALGAGGSVDLTLAGDHLLSYHVSSAALQAQAKNGGVIQAPGGRVILTAQAKNALLQTVVNNTGVVQAQTVADVAGTIELLGGSSGTVKVAGTLDASAPNGGNGGTIETSGQHVQVADHTAITTEAVAGRAGQWTIDPDDFTIAASGGDITGATLSTALKGGNVKIQSTAGAQAGSGDIHVDDTVTWNQHTLTLNAYRDIDIDTAMDGSGTAGLALQYGQGSASGFIDGTTATYHVSAPVNLASTGSFSTKLGSSGATTSYTIITILGAPDSTTGTDLQGINGNLSGNYVLGANINAGSTKSWSGGFTPIGVSPSVPFTGTFDGLGHTVSGLIVSTGGSAAGLIGVNAGTLRNIGAVDGGVLGGLDVGGLVGENTGTITDAYTTNTIRGPLNAGGLVGENTGTITDAYAAGAVLGGGGSAGGLVGENTGTITNAYATSNVEGGYGPAGGLVGENSNGTITDAYANNDVAGRDLTGGLVGKDTGGTIHEDYWNKILSGQATSAGGGTGLTIKQMRQASNFAGWNIDTNGSAGTSKPWRIYNGHTAPLLTAFLTPLAVATNDSPQTYDGAVQTSVGGYAATGSYTPSLILGAPATSGGGRNAGSYALDTGLYSRQKGYDLVITPGTLTITPATLTLKATGATKVYDGGTTSKGAITVSGLQGSDTVAGLAESYGSKDVMGANDSTLSVNGGYTIDDGNDGKNYTVTADTAKGTITPATLTLSNLAASNKTYDATVTANATGTLQGVLKGDDVTDVLAAAFDNKNAGANKTVTVTGISLHGVDAEDYAITDGETTTANITPATLTLDATRATKTYDGTVASDGAVKIVGLHGNDAVTGATESYGSEYVLGNDRSTLLVNQGYTIDDGNDGKNYTVTADTAKGTITPKALTLTGLTVGNKVADGNTAATVTHYGTLQGVLPGDLVGLDDEHAKAIFTNPQAGTHTVDVTGLSLRGSDAGNYTLSSPQTATATISPAAPQTTDPNAGHSNATGAAEKKAVDVAQYAAVQQGAPTSPLAYQPSAQGIAQDLGTQTTSAPNTAQNTSGPATSAHPNGTHENPHPSGRGDIKSAKTSSSTGSPHATCAVSQGTSHEHVNTSGTCTDTTPTETAGRGH